ncbi:hypothetical protein HY969_02565 [Candidatus Kaiserbacteria bacterium]|nr:hypothetical protein [Candidatus Kaiserbacteria bacterium]
MSIQESIGRIKGVLDRGVGEWGIPIIVVFVGLASFGLGRLSAEEAVQPIVTVTQAAMVTEATQMIRIGGQVVASRSGNAYHYPWCPGAATMKEANKIWFKDEAAARAAGYKPAGNCKGLK